MTLKKIENIIASPLFMTVAILETVGCVISFALRSIDILSLLICIGLWLAFAAAKGGKLSEKPAGLKMISGTVKAEYIITWIVFAFVIIGAVLTMAIGPALVGAASDEVSSNPEILQEPIEMIMKSDTYDTLIEIAGGSLKIDGVYDVDLSSLTSSELAEIFSEAIDSFGEIAPVVFALIGVMLLIFALALALVNIFFIGNLHKLTKSVCVAFETGEADIKKLKTVRVWFIVLAVLTGIGTLNSLIIMPYSAIVSACGCVSLILAVIMMNKFESEDEIPPEISEPTQTPEQL